jgi:hypothetical protein
MWLVLVGCAAWAQSAPSNQGVRPAGSQTSTGSTESGPDINGSLTGANKSDPWSKVVGVPDRLGGAVDGVLVNGLTRVPRLQLAMGYGDEVLAPRVRWRIAMPFGFDFTTSLHLAGETAVVSAGFEQGVRVGGDHWIRMLAYAWLDSALGVVHVRPQVGWATHKGNWSATAVGGVDVSIEGQVGGAGQLAVAYAAGPVHVGAEGQWAGAAPWAADPREAAGLVIAGDLGEIGVIVAGGFFDFTLADELPAFPAATVEWQLPW